MLQTLEVGTLEASNVAGAVEALKHLSQLPYSMGSKRRRRVPQAKVPQLVDGEGTKEYSFPVCFHSSARLRQSMKEHPDIGYQHEAIRNAIPELDFQDADTELYSLPSDTELRTKSNTEFVVDLVTHSLACAARSLPIPEQDRWAESWSRVRALAIGRIGNAHCWVARTELHLHGQSILLSPEGKTEEERELLKREARFYLAALMSAVEATPPCLLWQTDHSELRRRNFLQEFFLDGKNHRQLGFIHPTLLPRSAYFP